MRTFHTLPPHTDGFASYFAAMQLEMSSEIPEQRELAQLPALLLLKSLDDLDEEPDEDEDEVEDLDEDDDDEDEDEDEEDLEDEYDDDEDDEDEDDDDEDEDEEEDDVKPLKMNGLSTPSR